MVSSYPSRHDADKSSPETSIMDPCTMLQVGTKLSERRVKADETELSAILFVALDLGSHLYSIATILCRSAVSVSRRSNLIPLWQCLPCGD